MARRYVVPVALLLDVLTTLIRIAETSIQLVLPDVGAAWLAHKGPLLTPLYYGAGITVIIGISVGVTASLFLAMPLTYQINKRLDAALRIKNRRVRKEMSEHLRAKRKRYQGYVALSCAVPLLFSASFFLGNLHWPIVQVITAAADIAAPLIILFVITQTEREAGDVDAQEQSVQVATSVVLSNLSAVKHNEDGELRPAHAQMLRAGADGDLDGMIEAATPRDDDEQYYTVTDICGKLGVSDGRESSDRKRVWRIVNTAFLEGKSGVRRAPKGRGYLVPSSAFDRLFGDYRPSIRADALQGMRAGYWDTTATEQRPVA
jgi:hypothetical protein